MRFKKYLHIVVASFSGSGHSQPDPTTDTGVIPAEYLPAIEVTQPLSNNSNQMLSYFVLRTDGRITFANPDAWGSGVVTYIAN